jgi:hypothetical protein
MKNAAAIPVAPIPREIRSEKHIALFVVQCKYANMQICNSFIFYISL